MIGSAQRGAEGSVPSAVMADGLLGRDEELSGVIEALEGSRLVTLTGAPGIGKTRLALAVAESHHDRTAVVELAPVADPALVPAALASTLSVEEVPGQSLINAVVATFGRRPRMLLVLDNCEHLLGACARVIDDLLAGCPLVRVLATSREPMGLESERVWKVPPLPVPAPADDSDPQALMASPALALFVKRACDAQPGFALNAVLASEVAEICRRLDGIPLAIELAAARVGTLTPREIAGRLQDRLGLLSHGADGHVPRHRTLAAALDWSYALLRAPERVLLRRLSVFAGRFDLEAADAVCAGGEVDPFAMPGILVRLAAKSLLVADVDSGGRVRYRLLETIREYAAEKLERAGEVAEFRTAHAEFYVSLAERAEPELAGPRQEAWFERLEAERANIGAALDWSVCHGQTELALRLAGALVLFWRVRCHFSEGRDLLHAVLAASEAEAPAARAKALWGAGFLAFMAGDATSAVPLLDQSLAIFRERDDRQGCARALLILANIGQLYGDPSVLESLAKSAQLARDAGDRWCLAHALGLAGFECARRDDLARARKSLAECLAVGREAGDKQSLRIGLLGLGQVAVSQGDYCEAESVLEEAVHVTGTLGEDFGTATALRHLGALALGRGEYGRARELLDQALAHLPEAAPQGASVEALLLLARVAHAQGDRHRARRLLEGVRRRGRGVHLFQALGELAVDEGDPAEGARLFEEARNLARVDGKKAGIARALHGLGQLARAAGDHRGAAALHNDALELLCQVGDLPAVAGSLEAAAGLAAEAGQRRHAARLFGAAKALRARGGYVRSLREDERYEADLALCQSPAEDFASAFARGQALSVEQAVAEAARRLRGTRPVKGWPSLTQRELQVAELVAAGLTNPEIAKRLVISLETAKTHLCHIYAKLGMTGRSELKRELRSRNG